MSDSHQLDRIVWNALHGAQAALAVGTEAAVRIDPAFGPFAAACDEGAHAQAALAALLSGPGDELWLVEPRAWPAPPGTRAISAGELVQMVAEDGRAARDAEAELLGAEDWPAMAALARATKPGPWGPRTQDYGSYFGIRRDGRLAAMAGERLRPAPGWAEVSAICTWPEFRGQGLGARLTRHVLTGFAARGDRAFLQAWAGNAIAIALYERLGFRLRRKLMATRIVAA